MNSGYQPDFIPTGVADVVDTNAIIATNAITATQDTEFSGNFFGPVALLEARGHAVRAWPPHNAVAQASAVELTKYTVADDASQLARAPIGSNTA